MNPEVIHHIVFLKEKLWCNNKTDYIFGIDLVYLSKCSMTPQVIHKLVFLKEKLLCCVFFVFSSEICRH